MKVILQKLVLAIILDLIILYAAAYAYVRHLTYTEDKTQQIYKELWAQTGQGQDRIPLVIVNSPIENAYTDGERVVIYTGLIEKTNSWDEIALVLGHEIAHNTLAHLKELDTTDPIAQSILEANADKMGAIYMMKAGWDICKGRQIYGRWFKTDGNYLGQDHPEYSYRYAELNIGCD